MSAAFVREAAGDSSSGGSSISTAAFGSAVSTSNVLICFAMYYRAAGVITTTFSRAGDPAGTTVGSFFDTTYGTGMAVGFITGLTANTNVVTASFSSSVDANRGAWGVEVSGADATAPISAYAGQYNPAPSGTDGLITGNGNPTNAPGLRLGVGMNFNSSSIAAGTGFVSRGTAWTLGFGCLARLIDAAYAATGSQSGATWTAGAGDFGTAIMGFIRDATAVTAHRRLTTLGVG